MPDENDKPATKADISLLATKTDITLLKTDITRLDKKIDRVAVEVVKTQGQMQQMEERINAKMDTRFNQVLSAIAAYVKKWERSDRDLAIQNKVLFESLSPEGQAQVRSIWDEPDLAKKDALLALQNKVLFESLSPEGQAHVQAAWDELGLAKRASVC